ncbi:hypothetical protein [Flavobacterium sp.]
MTFYKQFILDLQELIDNNVPEIKFVDQNLGQWGNDNFRAAISFPGILIDFPTTSYSELSGGSQLGLNDIKMTLFFDVNTQSYNKAPMNIKSKALDYFELEQKLVAVLTSWETDYFTTLTRTTAVSRNQNEIGLRIRELTFTTEHEEYLEDCNVTDKILVIDFTGQIQTGSSEV